MLKSYIVGSAAQIWRPLSFICEKSGRISVCHALPQNVVIVALFSGLFDFSLIISHHMALTCRALSVRFPLNAQCHVQLR